MSRFLSAKSMTSQRYSLVTYAAYDVYCTNHDWNTLDKILELDAPSYYMMNILDYLVGIPTVIGKIGVCW